MGVYNLQQITNIAVKRPNGVRIDAAKQYNSKLMLHLHGVGMKNALKQMQYFENLDIYKARRDYAISNIDLFSRLLNEESQVFTVRGGTVSYNLNKSADEQMTAYTTDLVNGMSLRNWMQSIALQAYRADPMGLIFMEIEAVNNFSGEVNRMIGVNIDGGIQMPKCYPTYKSIQTIWDYKNVGRKLDYVMFLLTNEELVEYGIQKISETNNVLVGKSQNPVNVNQKKYFRFVDDEKDVIVELENNVCKIMNIEGVQNPLPNPFGKVPAFIVSDIMRFSDPQSYESPLLSVIELADCFLFDRSTRDLTKKHHGFPKAIEPLLTCVTCGGEGFVKGVTCPECTLPGQSKGTGYKLQTKVADVTKFPMEILKDNPSFDFKKIFGYVGVEVESLDKMDASLESLEQLMYRTYWGCDASKASGMNGKQQTVKDIHQTATMTIANLQPKYSKLNYTANWAERSESMVLELMVNYYFNSDTPVSVNYNRNYILETPDDILQTYYDMKKNGVSDSLLDEQYIKYIKAIYNADPIMQEVYVKKLYVEPFPHMQPSEVEQSNIVTNIDKIKKRYFGEWETTILLAEWISNTKEQLKENLTIFAKSKYSEVEIDNQKQMEKELKLQTSKINNN